MNTAQFDQAAAQKILELKQYRDRLDLRLEQMAARIERLQREYEEESRKARETFGTDDPDELLRGGEALQNEIQETIKAYTETLRDKKHQIDQIEKQLQEIES